MSPLIQRTLSPQNDNLRNCCEYEDVHDVAASIMELEFSGYVAALEIFWTMTNGIRTRQKP